MEITKNTTQQQMHQHTRKEESIDIQIQAKKAKVYDLIGEMEKYRFNMQKITEMIEAENKEITNLYEQRNNTKKELEVLNQEDFISS